MLLRNHLNSPYVWNLKYRISASMVLSSYSGWPYFFLFLSGEPDGATAATALSHRKTC
jgi:hypothetical protein